MQCVMSGCAQILGTKSTQMTTFYTVMPDICGSFASSYTVVPRMGQLFLDFWKIYVPLCNV